MRREINMYISECFAFDSSNSCKDGPDEIPLPMFFFLFILFRSKIMKRIWSSVFRFRRLCHISFKVNVHWQGK